MNSANTVTLRIREATQADTLGISQLSEAVFGYALTADMLQRKFWGNPDGLPIIVIAQLEAKVVGQYALWPTRLNLGGEVVMGAQSLDTMTHPDFRGIGVFVRLAEAAVEIAQARGIAALYGFPNSSSYPGFVRRLGWDHTGDVEVFVRPLVLSRHPRVPAALGFALDWGMHLWPSGAFDPGVTLDYSKPDEARLSSILTECIPSGHEGCAVHQSVARWQWRFSGFSSIKYEWVSAIRGGRIVAVAVWGVDKSRSRALLSGLFGADTPALSMAVKGVIHKATEARVSALQAINSIPAITPILTSCGFVRRGRSPLIVRKTTVRTLGANVHDHAQWRIFGADLDTY